MFDLYRLSYLWYTLLGALVSIFVATIITFLTGPLDPKDIDPTLLAPFVRRLIPPRKFPNQPKATEIIYAYKQVRLRRNAFYFLRSKCLHLGYGYRIREKY